jgi:hypothetical protein
MLPWLDQAVSSIGMAITVLAAPLIAVSVLHAGTFRVGLLSAADTIGWLLYSRCPPGRSSTAQANAQ